MARSDIDISRQQLMRLIPLGSLNAEGLRQVLKEMSVDRVAADEQVFEQGDLDDITYYLIEGKIRLEAGDSTERVVEHGTEQSRYALANLKPRQFTATTVTDCLIARIKSSLLDRLLSWDQVIKSEVDGVEVTELASGADTAWMVELMSNKLFAQLPPTNIQALISRMQRLERKAGEVIIRQGDDGDYYYVIRRGHCLVSRKSAIDANTVQLAALAEGQGFGEEALISGAPRNATVSMLTDGVLMCLDKRDFIELLEKSVVKRINVREVSAKVKAGAMLIDVRLEDEHKYGSIKNAVNIPLYLLRLKADALDPGRPYIVFCDTGARSSAAAFLLSQKNLDVFVLDGGLDKYAKAKRH
jgi:CRP-like cAMP-binding protein